MPYEISQNASRAGARPLWPAIKRGFACKCPSCGRGAMYGRYLKVEAACASCGEELHHHRADDAPPYVTMTIVGHIVVALVLIVERRWQPDLWLHAALWMPLTIGLSLWMLPRIKGALVAQQWALRMHGFAGTGSSDPAAPEAWAGDTVRR